MPSLLGTYVAANYGRLTSQDTYGGVTFSNFGTRNLAFLTVNVAKATVDFEAAPSTDPNSDSLADWQDSLSPFSVAVRTLQQSAEVYFVGAPGHAGSPATSSFVVGVAIDTANDAAANSNREIWQSSGYPALGSTGDTPAAWAQLAANLDAAFGTSGAFTVNQVTLSGAGFSSAL